MNQTLNSRWGSPWVWEAIEFAAVWASANLPYFPESTYSGSQRGKSGCWTCQSSRFVQPRMCVLCMYFLVRHDCMKTCLAQLISHVFVDMSNPHLIIPSCNQTWRRKIPHVIVPISHSHLHLQGIPKCATFDTDGYSKYSVCWWIPSIVLSPRNPHEIMCPRFMKVFFPINIPC